MHRTLSILFIISFYLLLSPAMAAEGLWVTTEGRAELVNITVNEAKVMAINDARRQAAEQVAGVRLSSATLVQDFQVLSDLINSSSYGQIVAQKIIRWDTESLQKDPASAPVIIYKVKIKALVARPEGEPDPSFQIEASLNKNVFNEGEEMTLLARFSRDCYVTLINLSADGKAIPLVPSQIREENHIPAGSIFQFPDLEERQAGISLRVGTLPGHKNDREAMVIVATKRRQPLPPRINEEKSYSSEEFGKWLVELPLSERTVKIFPYQILGK
jgi:hypothetical protein